MNNFSFFKQVSQKQVASFAHLFWNSQGELVEDAPKAALSRTGTKLERLLHQCQWGDLTKHSSTGCPIKASSIISASQNTELSHYGQAICQQRNQDLEYLYQRNHLAQPHYGGTAYNQMLQHRHNLLHRDLPKELFPRYVLCFTSCSQHAYTLETSRGSLQT